MKTQKQTNICTEAIKQLSYPPKTRLLQFPKFYEVMRIHLVLKHCWKNLLSSDKATLRNNKKLAAINRDNHDDHPRKNQARNTNSPGVQEY